MVLLFIFRNSFQVSFDYFILAFFKRSNNINFLFLSFNYLWPNAVKNFIWTHLCKEITYFFINTDVFRKYNCFDWFLNRLKNQSSDKKLLYNLLCRNNKFYFILVFFNCHLILGSIFIKLPVSGSICFAASFAKMWFISMSRKSNKSFISVYKYFNCNLRNSERFCLQRIGIFFNVMFQISNNSAAFL